MNLAINIFFTAGLLVMLLLLIILCIAFIAEYIYDRNYILVLFPIGVLLVLISILIFIYQNLILPLWTL